MQEKPSVESENAAPDSGHEADSDQLKASESKPVKSADEEYAKAISGESADG